MCECPKCKCYSMEISGEPFISNWGYGWNKSDTDTIRWFTIEIPYKCSECGYEENEEVSAND